MKKEFIPIVFSSSSRNEPLQLVRKEEAAIYWNNKFEDVFTRDTTYTTILHSWTSSRGM